MSALLKSFCEEGDEALQLNHTSLWDCQEMAHNTGPSERLNVLAVHGPALPLTWLDRMGHSLFSRWSQWGRPLNTLRLRAQHIQQLASQHAQDSDASLRDYLRELAMDCRLAGGGDDPRSAKGRSAEQITGYALAGVSLAVERIHGFRPHQEQIMGALVLLDGKMAEMATGEGKTLTAAMAAIVAAWRGLPCHVVTANEYLAKRDAELGQPLYAFCHVSAASVDGEMQPQQRAAAYAHDVVFCTAQQLLGDYLRDGLLLGAQPSRSRFALDAARQGERSQGVVMRGMWQLIIDEADSVLIDEAVTPLIIAAQQPDSFLEQAARDAAVLASRLQENIDYKMKIALRHIELTALGRERLSALTQDFPPFWRQHERACELVQMALYASRLMLRDQHYVIEEGKIILVDELTGRLADQRTLSLGMQQILEASQSLEISPPTVVSARMSFQRFFQRAGRLGGMTGTAEEARSEFLGVYRLTTLKIPTHKPVQRQVWPIFYCKSEQEKFEQIAQSALAQLALGRAVLIGMRSVRSSAALYAHIQALRPELEIGLLHAVQHQQESALVARAGQPGALTIATNMAGRGTDIALHESVKNSGGLHVVIGEANDFSRIDRQLLGRGARQGNPGSVQYFIAEDEELLRRFLPDALRRLGFRLYGLLPRAYILQGLLKWAQHRAERQAWQQRKNILKMDTELERSGF